MQSRASSSTRDFSRKNSTEMATPAAAGIIMPQPRALNFGTALTANLLEKMTVTYEMNVRRDEIVVFSLFDSLMKGPMPQTQEDLTAVLSVETDKEKLVDHLASSYIYDKIVKEPGLHTRIVTIQLNYQFLYSTPSLLPQWDVIYATATTLLGWLSRQREAPRAPAMGASSSMLVTNYKPPRLSDKQHDSQMSRVAGLGWLRGFREDIGISRPTGRRLPSEEEPTAGGEAHPLKEEDKRKEQEKREAGGWEPFLFGWLLQPRSSGGGWAAARPVGTRRQQHTDSGYGVCVSMVCVSMVCVSTPSRNLASPETATYCYAIHRLLFFLPIF